MPRLATVTVLAVELLAFLFAMTLVGTGHDRAGLVLVAVAMGMQNTLHQIVAGADVGKGFITGALYAFGQSLARLATGKAKIGQAVANAASWLAFVGGVVAGACILAAAGILPSLAMIAVLIAALIAAICAGKL